MINLDQTPHPVVEDHYHIRDLITAQERRTAARVKWQQFKKNEDAFLKFVQDFKDIELLDFFCAQCGHDFLARAHKQIDSWGEAAYYKMKHKCGEWAIRLITDRERDPYFYRSKMVAIDRGQSAQALLQPFETGYNMVYGKK